MVTKHPDRKAVAVGHARRKLLHLAFAIWKTGKPFDRDHYPWDTPAHAAVEMSDPSMSQDAPADRSRQAAGLTPDEPAAPEVTAACRESVAPNRPADESTGVDFAHVKKQLPLARVLEHLGLTASLRGSGPQRRGACPIQRGDGRGRTFSVHLGQNVFHCFDAGCGRQGDVIDLWAALHHHSLREAALDLVRTFNLEPVPTRGTEKRHG